MSYVLSVSWSKNVSHLVAVVTAFTKIVTAFVLLYSILGWRWARSFYSSTCFSLRITTHSSLVGIGVIVISLPVPTYLVKMRQSIQKKKMKKSDERLQTVTQSMFPLCLYVYTNVAVVMNVLPMIKLFGWEQKFEAK